MDWLAEDETILARLLLSCRRQAPCDRLGDDGAGGSIRPAAVRRGRSVARRALIESYERPTGGAAEDRFCVMSDPIAEIIRDWNGREIRVDRSPGGVLLFCDVEDALIRTDAA